MTGSCLAGIRFQSVLLRRSPGDLTVLVTTPFLTLAFGLILKQAHRTDLAEYAVLGPAVMAMWGMAVFTSGDIIDTDRGSGTLEALIAAPALLPAVITGRVAVITAASLLSVPESLLTARIVPGLTISVAHPWLLTATVLVTAAAMACTATAFSALFVLTRTARTFQNSLSYPFYLLSGAVVPVALLPGWLHPLARAVFLSWSSDLIRASMHDGPAPAAGTRIAVITALGLGAYAAALGMLRTVLHRARATGTAGYQ